MFPHGRACKGVKWFTAAHVDVDQRYASLLYVNVKKLYGIEESEADGNEDRNKENEKNMKWKTL
jgi:hypothetical protein